MRWLIQVVQNYLCLWLIDYETNFIRYFVSARCCVRHFLSSYRLRFKRTLWGLPSFHRLAHWLSSGHINVILSKLRLNCGHMFFVWPESLWLTFLNLFCNNPVQSLWCEWGWIHFSGPKEMVIKTQGWPIPLAAEIIMVWKIYSLGTHTEGKRISFLLEVARKYIHGNLENLKVIYMTTCLEYTEI